MFVTLIGIGITLRTIACVLEDIRVTLEKTRKGDRE
jgi:hypothetical protein